MWPGNHIGAVKRPEGGHTPAWGVWQAGSVARVLEGRKPVNAPDALLAQVLDVWPRLGQRDRRLLAVLLAELTR